MLVIKEATYGVGGTTVNVTKVLQDKIKDGSIDILVGPKELGKDPSVGTEKKLSVIYVVDGVQEQKTIKDGSQFAVYTKAAKEETPRDQVGQVTTNLFKTAISGLSMFVHLLGVGIAYKVGTTVFDPIIGYVLTGLALIIPYYGIWGVPFLVFIYRIFSSQDISALTAVPAQVVTDMASVAN
jgi:hypothetical protein